MELVTSSKIILLDEPTSGLSSHDASELIGILRNLSNRIYDDYDDSSTILYKLYTMDHLLLLEEGGHCAYFGPTRRIVLNTLVFMKNPDALLSL